MFEIGCYRVVFCLRDLPVESFSTGGECVDEDYIVFPAAQVFAV